MATRSPVRYRKEPVPYNLTICKGVKNVLLNRPTVEFLVYDRVAIDLYNWLQDVEAPEENFYSTLIRITAMHDHNGDDEREDFLTPFNRKVLSGQKITFVLF